MCPKVGWDVVSGTHGTGEREEVEPWGGGCAESGGSEAAEALAGLRILHVLRSMEMPFQEARPENGAGLVPADNSAPHKEELSFKVSVGQGEKAHGRGTGCRWASECPPLQHGPASALPTSASLFLFLALDSYS